MFGLPSNIFLYGSWLGLYSLTNIKFYYESHRQRGCYSYVEGSKDPSQIATSSGSELVFIRLNWACANIASSRFKPVWYRSTIMTMFWLVCVRLVPDPAFTTSFKSDQDEIFDKHHQILLGC